MKYQFERKVTQQMQAGLIDADEAEVAMKAYAIRETRKAGKIELK